MRSVAFANPATENFDANAFPVNDWTAQLFNDQPLNLNPDSILDALFQPTTNQQPYQPPMTSEPFLRIPDAVTQSSPIAAPAASASPPVRPPPRAKGASAPQKAVPIDIPPLIDTTNTILHLTYNTPASTDVLVPITAANPTPQPH
jgi:hypothetical protein